MRAIVFDGTLKLKTDYPRPEPSGLEALVRVRYAGVCSTDLEIVKGYMGFRGVPGHEFAGVVEECADSAYVGRRVVGEINLSCGGCHYCVKGLDTHCPERGVLGIYNKDGAFAEYLTLPVKLLHLIPDPLSDDEAVFAEPVAAAFEILEQVDIGKGVEVCVVGDGRLGMIIAEVLSQTGCGLTVAGRHPEKLSILDRRGIKTSLAAGALGRVFDVVVDASGSASGFEASLALARPRGTIILKTTIAGRDGVDLNRVVIDEIKVIGSRCGPFGPALKALAEGRVDVKPLISRVFKLEDGVKAIEYAAKKGVLKVLIDMG